MISTKPACSYKDMFEALYAELHDKTVESVGAESHKSGTRLNLICRCLKVHFKAENSKAAAAEGIIGVGLIAYAERRMNRFMRRINFHI